MNFLVEWRGAYGPDAGEERVGSLSKHASMLAENLTPQAFRGYKETLKEHSRFYKHLAYE